MKDLSVMVDNVKFNYRVGLLIEKDNKIYVECNPDIDFVTLPGGRVKTMESTIDAIIREIKEEMNITIEKSQLAIKAIIENFFEMNNIKYHELYFLYKINYVIDDLKDDKKNIDSDRCYYRWIKKEDLSKVKLLPEKLIDVIKKDEFELIINNDLQKKDN